MRIRIWAGQARNLLRMPGVARLGCLRTKAANGRFRRNLAVAARTCDGPFAIWFADLHRCAMQHRERIREGVPRDRAVRSLRAGT
jgi:hypothetical protein